MGDILVLGRRGHFPFGVTRQSKSLTMFIDMAQNYLPAETWLMICFDLFGARGDLLGRFHYFLWPSVEYLVRINILNFRWGF